MPIRSATCCYVSGTGAFTVRNVCKLYLHDHRIVLKEQSRMCMIVPFARLLSCSILVETGELAWSYDVCYLPNAISAPRT